MKTRILLLIVMMATTSCAQSNKANKTLIVYFSHTGNTETVAKQIQELTGADIFRIETMKTYPAEWHPATEVAKVELDNNARPEIKRKVENIDQYETVFIGFPIWWNTYPRAIATFIESHNLKGKTVIPFCTHNGGGGEQGFADIEMLIPESGHKNGLSIFGKHTSSSKAEVEKWLREIEVIK